MFCQNCFKAVSEDSKICEHCGYTIKEPVSEVKGDHWFLGGIGAIIGSIPGIISIILLFQLGWIGGISGVILTMGIMFGYKLFEPNPTEGGIVVCFLTFLLAPIIAIVILGMMYKGEVENIDLFLNLFKIYFFSGLSAIIFLKKLNS
ncbi:MAG: hypothetical protein E7288_00900 [Lachnospiraceae bacterium]|nr:hypothetical protein [Lachnospiraceae bacterium]